MERRPQDGRADVVLRERGKHILPPAGSIWLSRCFWLNHPSKIADAEYKPLQLLAASECGLRVPRSLITNDPAAVRSFHDLVGGIVVCKPLSGTTFTKGGSAAALFTSPI